MLKRGILLLAWFLACVPAHATLTSSVPWGGADFADSAARSQLVLGLREEEGGRILNWDARNRLVAVTNNQQQTTINQYNPEGDRVATPSGDSATEVDPATWRKVVAVMDEGAGSGAALRVELLRPADWIGRNHARAGAMMRLDLPEMGIAGWARVEAVESCPPVAAGAGRVVTGTISRGGASVVAVRLKGGGVLEATPGHPIYSASRGGWVGAGGLAPGEQVRTQDGLAAVESVESGSGLQRVFNLEVEAEHCYFAGVERVLSHNACAAPAPKPAGNVAARGTARLADDVATLKSIRRHTERLVQGKATSSNPATMLEVRDIQAAIANGNYRGAGTGFHELNFRFAGDAQGRGFLQNLNIDQRISTPGGFLRSRRPDYLFDGGGIYDIKPFRPSAGAYDTTRQFLDIQGATGTLPVPLYYRLW